MMMMMVTHDDAAALRGGGREEGAEEEEEELLLGCTLAQAVVSWSCPLVASQRNKLVAPKPISRARAGPSRARSRAATTSDCRRHAQHAQVRNPRA